MIDKTFIVYNVNLIEKGKNMITFISPAKGFNENTPEPRQTPVFVDQARQIVNELKKLDKDQISSLMKIKNDLAQLNLARFSEFKYDKMGLYALLAYSGIQYKTMLPETFSQDQLEFLDRHLRIVSGLYGILRPSDSIYPYRLEMLTKLEVPVDDVNHKNLYSFWGDKIASKLEEDSDGVIVNLASDEYSKTIKKHLSRDTVLVSCTFKVNKKDKLKVESTASKKARGLMVSYITKNKIDKYTELKNFCDDGYVYRDDLSVFDDKDINLVFVKDAN